MYLYTKNVKETLEKIEKASSIRWHSGQKPTEFFTTDAMYVVIETDDIEWGLMLSNYKCEDDTGDAETFVKKCAELAPKDPPANPAV